MCPKSGRLPIWQRSMPTLQGLCPDPMTPVPLTRHQPPAVPFQACSQKALARLATLSLPLTRQPPAMTCYLEARYVGRDLLRSRAGHALHLARQHVVDRGPVPARQPLHQRWPLGHHTRRVVAEGPINACGHVPHRRRDHLFRHRIPGRNRYNFTERWAQMRSFLVVLLLLPIACSQPVTKQSNLEKKARCATIGRAFIKELERKTGGMPTIVDPTYAYNSAADTCLCRYGLHFGIPSTGNSC